VSAVGVRPAVAADAAAIARVRVDAWRSTYRGMMPDAYLDGMNVADNAAFWERIIGAQSPLASVFVAFDEGTLVGFASANARHPPIHGFDAELSAIYLAAEHKRRGIGRRLVAAVAAAQRQRGASGLIAWVIAKNQPARLFYDALGGEVVAKQAFQWDGIDLIEVGYGFRDLDALAAAAGPNPAVH